MCLLVYPKNEIQKAELTSLFEKMGVEFEYEQSFLSDSLKKELDKRVIEIKEIPSIGIPFEEVKKKISEKYVI
ncbi:hypothetical protein [Capnocytophaga sp. oral taxon 336]|jgi:hypothetical protein|uniref:hypothetical protein n=1 Tax=Capnocytophaga sp. oral taxon 336 TaxID=712216 RepID=UPI00034E7036|nr:hypothetical protein [Capnocytophaga sp. oral taxon 336]EPE01730.1 hypothetical protein HMPREF1528_00564 [Capnocytophaga sp. oral taxon 336 str. F0502]